MHIRYFKSILLRRSPLEFGSLKREDMFDLQFMRFPNLYTAAGNSLFIDRVLVLFVTSYDIFRERFKVGGQNIYLNRYLLADCLLCRIK